MFLAQNQLSRSSRVLQLPAPHRGSSCRLFYEVIQTTTACVPFDIRTMACICAAVRRLFAPTCVRRSGIISGHIFFPFLSTLIRKLTPLAIDSILFPSKTTLIVPQLSTEVIFPIPHSDLARWRTFSPAYKLDFIFVPPDKYFFAMLISLAARRMGVAIFLD